ncbi:hypothetical protein Ae168Ps1_2053c [Pseudonocardia sp. Ae168_Ps1]|uniref:hypothetical protein n=1 Tax=unclassified Pseudonocardia TaxID=2619320 RepID=UPI0001FFE513|nr:MULTISPECIES: hypothetical protein [unclassified Pseudonocardia]OLL73672.1 hypothetical protein Ae150APs1_2050c [Pseudonocardia sp. Ae150A_Ps1]OLL79647.1 hypothetical protein Ae168Ps1_2053c [Pseudonocardia sp. Ae168_Ps1]OLL86214.1 hypothetical protein Ae263Ps1_3269 [Pseudonocardia sp. Ae263_Ps1]OLL93755.1 hypothetical protein Ae356Ps1_3652c [Pseudonocardia sp. Ae356_Ps1]OLM20258.1 hypothetical protein Ae707Ps1_4517c [Pseudonocardia sp. Ae707_Ps1]
MNRIQRVLALAGVAVAATASLVLVPPAPAHATVPTCNETVGADPAPGQAADPPGESSIIYRIAPDGRTLYVRFPPRTELLFNAFLRDTRTGDELDLLCGGTNAQADYVVQTWQVQDDQPDVIVTGVSGFVVNPPRHDEL